MPAKSPPSDASVNITRRIAELGDWRGKMLARVRQLIHEAHPEIVAALKDTKKLFNSSLEGNVRRAIDLREGDERGDSFKQLVRTAMAANTAARAKTKKR